MHHQNLYKRELTSCHLPLQVWQVLMDFESLPEFIPNLELTQRVPGAPPGRVWLRQRGCSQSLFWRLQAAALLELREVQRPLGRRELRFHMIEGDFQVSYCVLHSVWYCLTAGEQHIDPVIIQLFPPIPIGAIE